ncbi:MAG: TIGR03936 family radical SAM-associated protein [Defluviitaleaceae bacterium]|nr:TIGR03936 family radical SAM-associated protein [Defluviitaleaceae bacterium]
MSDTNKIRLRFSKRGTLAFIGHLDFLRVFQQTIRRAALPAAFSQGFNPHLLISFALPLPLGMESARDYVDLTLAEDVPCAEIVGRINAAAPKGLEVRDAYVAENKAASVVSAADYIVRGADFCAVSGKTILQSKEIIVAKKTKKGIKDTDIRADILGLEMRDDGVFMRLSAGSARFLNPLIVAELLLGEKPCTSAITRLELYREGESGEPGADKKSPPLVTL